MPAARPRVRLLQIRERPAILAEEQESFRVRCGLEPEQLVVTNVLRDPLPTSLLDGVDAVMIGGAGAYSVTQTFDWTPALLALVQACADRALPLFGSCWGHQFIARAFGGRVVNAPHRSEMGTHRVHLTQAGQTDALFGQLPPTFEAQMGHQDWVETLPADAIELATNDRAPHQAFRMAGLPIYGTQFHSELNATAERDRLVTYRAYYPEMQDDARFEAVVGGVRETPEVDALLATFLATYVAPEVRSSPVS
ncbi:MAG: type 1 glutamine amidotransferase [Bacteroidota bacterium]